MYALITDGSIAKYLSGNRGIQIGDIKYARDIYSKWTEAERNAIGIYEVIQNNAKKKDEAYYINTNRFFFSGGPYSKNILWILNISNSNTPLTT